VSELGLILLGAVLANNFVLVRFLGLCPFFGATARMETAVGMSLATAFVLTVACALAALVDGQVLAPLGLGQLRLLALIVIIAATVQLTELTLRATSPLLYRMLGLFLPLITTNCAVLGVALLALSEGMGFAEAAWYGFATAIGFSLVLVLFAGVRERLEESDVPRAFRGTPVALVSAGMMALAFMGFTGLGRPPG
jgi:electron transport complex protein RnfA